VDAWIKAVKRIPMGLLFHAVVRAAARNTKQHKATAMNYTSLILTYWSLSLIYSSKSPNIALLRLSLSLSTFFCDLLISLAGILYYILFHPSKRVRSFKVLSKLWTNIIPVTLIDRSFKVISYLNAWCSQNVCTTCIDHGTFLLFKCWSRFQNVQI